MDMEKFNADDLLPPFLRKLADRIEQKHISDKEIQLVGEFYMSYLFESQVEADDEDNEDEEHGPEMTEKDFRKFITLGWYAYAHIIPKGLANNKNSD